MLIAVCKASGVPQGNPLKMSLKVLSGQQWSTEIYVTNISCRGIYLVFHFNVFIACFVDKVPRVTGYKELEVGQLSYSKVTVNYQFCCL